MSNTLKGAIIFLLGGAVGAGTGYFVGKVIAEKKAEIDIAEIKEYYKAAEKASERVADLKKGDSNEDSKEGKEEIGSVDDKGEDPKHVIVRSTIGSVDNFDAHAVDYTKYSEPKKKGGRKKKKPVAVEISPTEWDEYDGNATVYRDLHWYPNADGRGPLLVDQSEDPVQIFIDSEKILNCFSKEDMKRFNKDEIYILTDPGVGGEDGILARVAIEYEDFFRETDLAWNSCWVESGEDTGFNAIMHDIENEGFKEED